MIRIINNTDIADSRMLVLYSKDIASVNSSLIECIVFESCKMTIFGINCILLETE